MVNTARNRQGRQSERFPRVECQRWEGILRGVKFNGDKRGKFLF